MSLALAHFAFGAAMTTLVVTFLVPTVRYVRTLVLVGGGWAMVPDAHLVSPVARESLGAVLAGAAWTDVFWLHRTMDRVDVGDSRAVAAAMVAVLLVVTALAERREYRAPAAVEEAYREYLDVDPPE